MNNLRYRRPDKVLVYLYRRAAPAGAGSALEYLLLQRQPQTTNAGSIWQTVVGAVRWGEELVHAARREVFEETGLTLLRGITAIGYAFSFPIRLRKDQKSRYGPDVTSINNIVFAAEVVNPRPIRLSVEHIDYGWFSYADAADKIHWPEEQEALSRLHPMLEGGVVLKTLD